MKKLVLASGLALAALTATAEYITPEQALARLQSANAPKAIRGRAEISARLVDTLPELYIFASGETYMILPADDIARPILGYCEDFDPEGNPSLAAWLKFYADEIAAAKGAGKSAAETETIGEHEAIAPLVKTQWGQGAPYCRLCPDDGTYYCVTGCVATAMAQVMKYHEWPKTSVGTHSYYWEGGKQTLSFDYGNTTFDWDNMLDIYERGSYSDKQGLAVATLMSAAGISVDMNYSTTGSGTSSYSIARALVENFNYDKALRLVERDYYTAAEWDAMIYGEIAAGRPVVYSGVTDDLAGHEFVVDGYSANGFYHLNWGWSGLSDGYFQLSALNPSSQGTGGSEGGYNYYQDAIIGMQPPVSGSKQAVMARTVDRFAPTTDECNAGDYVEFSGGFVNIGYKAVTISLGIKFSSVKDASVAEIAEWAVDAPQTLEPLYGWSSMYYLMPAKLADGNYYLTPVYKVKGETQWCDLPVNPTLENVRYAKVSGRTITFTDVAPEPEPVPEELNIGITGLKLSPVLYWGKQCTIEFIATNNMKETTYEGEVMPVLIDPTTGDAVAKGYYRAVSLAPGETYDYSRTYALRSLLDNSTAPAYGEYLLSVVDRSTMAPLCKGIAVELKPASSADIAITDLHTTEEILPGYGEVTFEMTATVNSGALINGYIVVKIGKKDDDWQVTTLISADTQTVSLNEGESTTLSATLDLSSLDPGDYLAAPFFYNKRCSPSIHITLPDSAHNSINGITATPDSTPTEYYDLQGRLIPHPATRGLYITPAGKLLLRR